MRVPDIWEDPESDLLYVDPRLGSVELMSVLDTHAPTVHQEMPFGDVAFWGNGPSHRVRVGFERKRLSDMITSVRDGRLLGHQIPGMIERYDFSYLIIEERYRCGSDDLLHVPHAWSNRWMPLKLGSQTFHHSELRSLVWSLINQTPIQAVIETADPDSTCREILYAHRWFSKRWDQHKAIMTIPDTSKDELIRAGRDQGRIKGWTRPRKIPRVARFAMGLDGVGADRAWALSDEFVSVEDLVLASVDDLRVVPGIGPKLAKSILRQLKEEG